jgi:transcriptional regulator with XRE-family HTH domain
MSAALRDDVLSCNMDHPIGRWRNVFQVSQAELAERCGLSQQSISFYEGGRVPRGEALRALIRVTGLPLEALVFPEQFLAEHPDFLIEASRQPLRRGRPRKQPPEGETDA